MIVPKLYEDLSVLHQNTMPDRAYYIPSSARDEMRLMFPRRIPAELTCIILNGTAAGKRPVHS